MYGESVDTSTCMKDNPMVLKGEREKENPQELRIKVYLRQSEIYSGKVKRATYIQLSVSNYIRE